MRQDTNFPEQGIWGDICCAECFLVLKAITVFEEGIYEFKKVSDIPSESKEVTKCGIDRNSKYDDCGHLNKVSSLPSKDTKKEGGE